MALQDLTPQLRTRLSRMERVVGWFVFLAVALLVCGFAYYIHNTAERKGWFKTKAPFFIFTDRATGLKIGDPITLMGMPVGQITQIEPMDPGTPYNICVKFELVDPYHGYIWTDGSFAKVTSADFLGNRTIEVTKGTNGYPVFMFHPLAEYSLETARAWTGDARYKLAGDAYDPSGQNIVMPALTTLHLTNINRLASCGVTQLFAFDASVRQKSITAMWYDKDGRYVPFRDGSAYWLLQDESGALAERLEKLVKEVEVALPNILALTNQINRVLSNSADLTSNLNVVALSVRPAISNMATLTAQLDRPGALGEWLIPTNINRQLDSTLGGANETIRAANTNLTSLIQNLNRSLDHLSSITGNFSNQMDSNTNLLETISKTIRDTDDLLEGLKRHWLLRSAFRNKAGAATNSPPLAPLKSPKGTGR